MLFEVGEKCISRFGLKQKILEVRDKGWYLCQRIEDGKIHEIHESELLKLDKKKR